MNYAGKFDAAISLDGQGFRSPTDGHVDSLAGKPFIAKGHGHVPDGAFVVPDPNLIFNGEFKRAGVDLVLSHDGHEFVVHDYFRGDKRAAIASPDGAHLTGDVVNALTGHVQYAQAAPGAAAAQVIGHVTKLAGSATAVRNGVSVILNNGDNVEKGDVVSTGSDSTLGITFIDGTVFGLSSNARMVLNEMVYDPNGSNNSSLLSLVAGTITFVAGETAKHGDMKVDTPVATMGIRGTAVLSQINFVVPAGGGDPQPQASFQVLVEPNGTTGSYILFDKVTLLPIATVNQAGQMIQISGGNVSISNALMSPDIQKLITDVFTLKFTDNNSNTKLTQNFTDTITQTGNIVFIKTDTGATATATFTNLNQPGTQGPGHDPSTSTRIPGPPDSRSLDSNGHVKTAFALTERADTTGDTTHSDTISGRITFVDQNIADQPSVSVSLGAAPNYVYKNAGQQDVTGSLNALQKQDIAATEIQISVVSDSANNNNGSAVWTYTIPDNVFDFLAAGETLTLTYMVRINNNFAVNPESTYIPITITITGTNDKPVITTDVPTITFEGGTSVPGGPLTSDVPTAGTLDFTDVDLTDTHTVSVALTSATLPDGTVPPGPLAAFESAMSVAIASGADSTGDGTGTINWSLADLPVYLADFIPKGEVLTLVYTVTLTDAQGATSQQTITVTITGTDAPAVVWIATNKAGAPSGGFWKDAANWETGTVPTINDDVIVITDQLHGLTPSYPVTIDAAAYAKSITMNDFGGPPPKLINQSSLTIAQTLNMSADSILTNAAIGTMSVGGKAEILDTAVLTNAGYLTLASGGDFAAGTRITNSGTIELTGGTLKTLAAIHNAGGTLKADAGTTLIVDSATIDGGTVTILGTLELDGASLVENGTLNNSGTVNVKGAAEFAHETVSNTSGGTIKVLANGWLTIDQGSSVANTGHITIDANGKLTVNSATISGGAIDGPGTIDITGASTIDGGATLSTSTVTANAKLTLDGITVSGTVITDNSSIELDNTVTLKDSAKIQSGAITNNGTLEIAGAATLLNDVFTNTGHTIHVDGGKTLTLSGTEISGGTIDGPGTIDITGASTIDSGATLSTSTVTVENGIALTLDGTTVSGATINDGGSVVLKHTVLLQGNAIIQNGPITNNGTLEIAGAATLLNDVLSNTGHTVQVDGGKTLTLSGTEISGGTIDGPGTIDITGASTIDGGATLSTSAVTVENGIALTLDGMTVSGATINDGGSVVLKHTVLLQGNAIIQNGPITNNGTLEIAGAATLLNDVLTNTGHTVQVDGGKTLTLSGTTVTGGTVTDTGTIHVTGNSAINGAAVSGGGITIDTLTTLTLDDTTITGSAITDNGTVKVDASKALNLNGVTLTGGAVNNLGTVAIVGDSALVNDGFANHQLTVDGGKTLTLSGTTVTGGTVTDTGTIHVTGNSAINGAAVSGGGITVDALTTLTLDDTTVTGSAITDNGTVKIDASKKLTLNGASLTGGTLVVSGTLASSGATSIAGANISNSYLIEAIGGVLALAGTSASSIANNIGGTIRANNAELDINGEPVTNAGTLAAINHGTLKLTGTTVSNTGTVSVEAGSTLDLVGAIINGGTVTISGTLESTGISAINGADFTNNGTIDVTSGTLSIDPTTITNNLLIEVNGAGAVLDISGDPIHNSGTLEAINGGTLKLSGLTVANLGGTVWVDNASKLYLSAVTINDGQLNNAGNVYSVSGFSTITAAVNNTGSIEVQAGTLDLTGGLTGGGLLIIDNGATLELAGATAQTVIFAGGSDTLKLDNVAGQSFTGTISGQSATDGTFTITGAANITTSSGDALDFTASGGTSGGNVVLTPTGVLTAAASGIVVTQNGTGSISLTATKDITGLNGNGITLRDSASGVGSITVNNLTGKATGTGLNSEGILVENLNAANGGNISITQLGGAVGGDYGIDATTHGGGNVTIDAGGTIKGNAIYGIRARSYGAGSETVTTEAGSVITSGSSGIVAVNRATSLDSASHSTITVNAYGTINSGSSLNQSQNTPAGIQAGYAGATTGSSANQLVYGSVVVNNHGNITAAAGAGIDAYNYGNGDVTVTDDANTTVIGAEMGIRALALSGGTGNVSISLGANASVTGTARYGLQAYSIDQGNISVTLSANDLISSGSSGILAVNEAASIGSGVHSTIQVTAHGTIHSGSISNISGATPGGIVAGYNPGGNGHFASNVYGDVTVDSDAAITADGGYGIEAFTWGVGEVTVTTGAASQIIAAGTAIGAFDHGGGDVSVTNEGSATGGVALGVVATGAGSVTIVNDGHLTATGTAGIIVTQNDTGATGNPVATGSTHITNTGSVAGASGHYAIFVQENTTGAAVIDNSASGTIGSALASAVTSTTYAIAESGGHITINNSGHINGNISVATATFNNALHGTWTLAGVSAFGNLSVINNTGEIDLLNGASISGTGLSIANAATGIIRALGNSTINTAAIGGGSITIDTLTTLTLDDVSLAGTTVTDTGTVNVDSGKVLSLAGVTLTGGSVNNLGTVEITGDSALVNDAFANHQLTVDATKILTLSGTTITGGTVTDAGAIHVTGDSAINGAALNGGIVTVDSGKTLTVGTSLTGTTVTGTTFAGDHATINVSGAHENFTLAADYDTMTVSGSFATVTVSGDHDTLSLNGAGDTVNIAGTNTALSLSGNNIVVNFTSSNTALTVNASHDTINVSGSNDTLSVIGSSNTINFTANNAKLDVDASSATINFNGSGETISTTGQNDTFVLGSGSDALVFNFANVGDGTVKNFDVTHDLLEFKSTIFATSQDALNAAHDDGHGNVVITLDIHDSITLKGIHLSQLTTNDFAIV